MNQNSRQGRISAGGANHKHRGKFLFQRDRSAPTLSDSPTPPLVLFLPFHSPHTPLPTTFPSLLRLTALKEAAVRGTL